MEMTGGHGHPAKGALTRCGCAPSLGATPGEGPPVAVATPPLPATVTPPGPKRRPPTRSQSAEGDER
jgi:hypothetical protein